MDLVKGLLSLILALSSLIGLAILFLDIGQLSIILQKAILSFLTALFATIGYSCLRDWKEKPRRLSDFDNVARNRKKCKVIHIGKRK